MTTADAADGYLGDWLPHKATCKCDDCRLDKLQREHGRNQRVIKALSEALGIVECLDCGHAYRQHLDKYGCEYELGDDGHPCGCNGKGSTEDTTAIAALALAKEAAK